MPNVISVGDRLVDDMVGSRWVGVRSGSTGLVVTGLGGAQDVVESIRRWVGDKTVFDKTASRFGAG